MRISTRKFVISCPPPRPCKRCLILSILGSMAVVLVEPAAAQTPPRFRVYDVGASPVVPQVPEPPPNIGLALNNRGDIVGQMSIPGVGNHAFIRVTQPGYGLLTTQVYDLNTLYGLNLPGDSIAHDINMNGEIAGQARPNGTSSQQAFVWRLATSSPFGITTIPLGQLGSGFPTSIAYSINDSNPAVVVGSTPAMSTCQDSLGQTLPAQITAPFRATLTASHPLEQLLGNHSFSEAFCINNESIPRIAGAYLKQPVPNPCDSPGTPPCEPDETQAASWRGSEFNELRSVTPAPLKTEDKARGNNDLTASHSSQTVGWGDETHAPGSESCTRRASFWETSAEPPADLVILGGILPPGHLSTHPTAAEAINNQSDPLHVQVVGQNIALIRAILWERSSGGSWSATDLTSAIPCPAPCTSCPASWTLRAALDINDNGWIVGWGSKVQTGGGSGQRIFLLTPITTCLADLNEDCVINTLDLGILLSSWSIPATAAGCGGAIPCVADMNCDGLVNSVDLGALLAAWTLDPPPPPGCDPNCVGSGSMLMGGSGSAAASIAGATTEDVEPPTLEQIIQSLIEMGESDLAALLQEIMSSQ